MKLVKKIVEIFTNRKYNIQISRLDTTIDDKNYDIGIKKVMNLLNYTKKSGVSYSAGNFNAGYHSFSINNYDFKGQRDPKMRFKDLPFSLKDMSIIDIGCNQGGMLHAFSKEIGSGIGIDYDARMINVANKIKSYTSTNNLDFYVFNLENEPLDYIYDFLPQEKVDVALLLSVCMWIDNWKEVIKFCKKISTKLIFESNGKPEQQKEQIQFLNEVYSNVQLINERSEDDPSQKLRQLFYCY
ncbi:MAG: methyltransferase [Bacteroidetes bacterium]|nr:methyltransferase [Bacteroidota bacterium]